MTTAIEVNCATGEVSERELTGLELEQREADAAAYLEQKAEDDKAAAAKDADKAAVLDRLGITADEAKLLLG